MQKYKLFYDNKLNDFFFYKNKNYEYIPYYKFDIQQLNPLNPIEFNFLFKEFDLPFIEDQWIRVIRDCFENNKSLKFVFGKYLARMALKSFCGFHYGDMILNGSKIIENKTLCEFTDEQIQEIYLNITKCLKERGIINDNN